MGSSCAGAIERWLMTGTREMRFIDDILAAMCNRFVAAGVPVARATLHLLINNPQWMGARLTWRKHMSRAEMQPVGYDIVQAPVYKRSPFAAIANGAPMVRQRVDREAVADMNPALLDELRAEGMVDYIAWPLEHTLGKRHLVTFASDAPEGFTDEHLASLAAVLPALALVSEIRLKNRLARTLLETYVGPHASGKILDGAIRRGDGETVRAAIIITDLRNFTSMSNRKGRDEVIAVLNGYFDALCQPIERNGGEILKFMGDGLLAIFPLEDPGTCAKVLQTVVAMQDAIAALNARRCADGQESLGVGIGVHVGDVMYGNIGSRGRLDFTVIGPAVNIASRLESLTKEVGRPALFSQAFVDRLGGGPPLDPVGAFPLKGLPEPVAVFALRGQASP